VALQRQQVNEMKVNGKNLEENVELNDGRVGWKYPLNSKQITKACEDFFKKRGMAQYNLCGRLKKTK
jgi:hypothetical protein